MNPAIIACQLNKPWLSVMGKPSHYLWSKMGNNLQSLTISTNSLPRSYQIVFCMFITIIYALPLGITVLPKVAYKKVHNYKDNQIKEEVFGILSLLLLPLPFPSYWLIIDNRLCFELEIEKDDYFNLDPGILF